MVTSNEGVYYAEVYYILNYLGTEYIQKLPQKLRDVIDNTRDKNYKFNFDETKTLSSQNFKQETRDFIAALNLIYWEKDEKKKQELMTKYKENDIIYQKELEEKYSYENLFKNRNQTRQVVEKEETKEIMVVTEEKNIIKKIINKIINIFRRIKK